MPRKDKHDLGGGFKYFLSSPLLGEMIQFDEYFSNGLKPPTSDLFMDIGPPTICPGTIGNRFGGQEPRSIPSLGFPQGP